MEQQQKLLKVAEQPFDNEDDMLQKLAKLQLDISELELEDSKRKERYIRDQVAALEKKLDEKAMKKIDELTHGLHETQHRHEHLIEELKKPYNKPRILQQLFNSRWLRKLVVPKSRGVFKRQWNKKKVEDRIKQGLIKETRHSNWRLNTPSNTFVNTKINCGCPIDKRN